MDRKYILYASLALLIVTSVAASYTLYREYTYQISLGNSYQISDIEVSWSPETSNVEVGTAFSVAFTATNPNSYPFTITSVYLKNTGTATLKLTYGSDSLILAPSNGVNVTVPGGMTIGASSSITETVQVQPTAAGTMAIEAKVAGNYAIP